MVAERDVVRAVGKRDYALAVVLGDREQELEDVGDPGKYGTKVKYIWQCCAGFEDV